MLCPKSTSRNSSKRCAGIFAVDFSLQVTYLIQGDAVHTRHEICVPGDWEVGLDLDPLWMQMKIQMSQLTCK